MGVLLQELRYDNTQDVALRLNGTVCMYRGDPVYVTNEEQRMMGNGDLTVTCFDLLTQKTIQGVHTSDEEFEVKAQALGFVNRPAQAVYVCRMPTRKQRQGLSTENCSMFGVGPGVAFDRNLQPVSRDMLRSRALGDMLKRNYPSISEAYDRLRKTDGCRSVAFNPRFVLTENEIGLVMLNYFTTPIAMYHKGTFMLTEKFEHYLPILKKLDVPCDILDI